MMEGFRWVGIVTMALWVMQLAQLATAAGTGNVVQAEEEEAPGTAVDRPAVAPGAVVDCPAPEAVVDGPAPGAVVDGPAPGAVEDGPARRTEDPDLEDVGPSSDGSEVSPSLRAEQSLAAAEADARQEEVEAVERARAEEAEAVERESRRKRRREHEVAEERAQTLANRRHLEMLEERLRGELRAEIAQEFEARVNQEVRSQILTQMAEGQFEGNQFPMLMQILLSMRDIASSLQARQDRLEQQVAEQSGVWSRAMERPVDCCLRGSGSP